jgi:ABC-type multidrug transport system fused ATPase/permease subunit
MRLVWRFVRAQPVTYVVSLVGATIYAAAAVATTVVLGRVTNDVVIPAFTTGTSAEQVRAGALALFAMGLLRAVSIVLRRYMAALTTFRTQASLRRSVTDRYLDVPLSYHRSKPTGELLAHADADVVAATEVLNPLPFSVGVLVLIVFAVASLVLVDPVVTVVALTLFPGLALLNRLYTARVEEPVAAVQERVGQVSRIAHESFDGALVVKTLGREREEVDRLGRAADALRDARVGVGRIRGVFEPAIDAIPNVGIIVVLLVGSYQVNAGNLSAGGLIQAVALFGLLAFPMRVVGFFLQELPRAVVSAERIDRVLAEPVAPAPEPDSARSLPPGAIGVAFTDVAFGYEEGVPVLDGVSFAIDPGEIVAVVGSTGSGKSTLCDMLARAADPQAGVVSVGGEDLRYLEPEARQAAVALVFQETFLFADSVSQNITLGAPFDEADVVRAARTAQADGFVTDLPRGYDTVVGERGVTLSGGQRQRVALARALVRRPRVLVLDDATSAVDPVIEAEILGALRATLDTTTLVVAHRVSTIELADRVVFLDDGRVAGVGSHTALLALPAYERIVRAYEAGEEP